MTSPETETGQKTVLIVDDDKSIRGIVRGFLLQHPNLKLLEAADGIEAVGVLLNEKVDLLIVDLQMPRMNGLEVVGFARRHKESRAMTIVMFTTVKDVYNRSKAMAQGVDVYVNKPFDPLDFSRIVDALLQKSARTKIVDRSSR